MLNEVFLWILFMASSALSLGCAVATLILAVGVFYHLRKDTELSVRFAALVLLLMILGMGFVFATVALGRVIL